MHHRHLLPVTSRHSDGAQIETDLPEEFMILLLKTRRPGKPLNNTVPKAAKMSAQCNILSYMRDVCTAPPLTASKALQSPAATRNLGHPIY
jgi:hypothetical protein